MAKRLNYKHRFLNYEQFLYRFCVICWPSPVLHRFVKRNKITIKVDLRGKVLWWYVIMPQVWIQYLFFFFHLFYWSFITLEIEPRSEFMVLLLSDKNKHQTMRVYSEASPVKSQTCGDKVILLILLFVCLFLTEESKKWTVHSNTHLIAFLHNILSDIFNLSNVFQNFSVSIKTLTTEPEI